MKKFISILLATLLLITFAGCSSTKPSEKNTVSDSSSTKSNEKITVLLDWTINTNHTGLYIALDNGYFEAEGLDVEIKSPPETGPIGIIASGKAQFGVSCQEEVINSRTADTPIKAIAAIIQHNTSGFASRKDAGIQTPKDFEGKRYGGWGSPMEENVIKALMAKHNSDFEKVKMLSIGSMDFFAATEKSVDFTWIFEGWDVVAAKLKGIELNYIPLRDEDPSLDYYTPVLVANENFIKDNPETTKKFLKAVTKGYKFAIDNPDKAADILLKYAPELDSKLVKGSQEFLAKEYQSDAKRWGEMKAEVWENFTQWMIDKKLLDKEIDPSKAFTNEFLPQN